MIEAPMAKGSGPPPGIKERPSVSIPDLLAIGRVLMVPIIMALVRSADRFDQAMEWGAVLFAVAAGTDFLDGYLARRWGIESTVGAFLDTTADKLLVFGTLLALTSIERASIWAVLVIVMREFVVMALRGIAAMSGTLVRPTFFGKAKAAVQFAAIFLAFLRPFERLGPMYLDQWVMSVAVVVTVLSGWQYVAAFWGVVRGSVRS